MSVSIESSFQPTTINKIAPGYTPAVFVFNNEAVNNWKSRIGELASAAIMENIIAHVRYNPTWRPYNHTSDIIIGSIQSSGSITVIPTNISVPQTVSYALFKYDSYELMQGKSLQVLTFHKNGDIVVKFKRERIVMDQWSNQWTVSFPQSQSTDEYQVNKDISVYIEDDTKSFRTEERVPMGAYSPSFRAHMGHPHL